MDLDKNGVWDGEAGSASLTVLKGILALPEGAAEQ
jgi:hypothetical protein